MTQQRKIARIKIVQPGWEGYTGEFGPAVFENGVSVLPLSPVHVDRIAAELKVVDVDDEAAGQVGVQVRMVENQCVRLSVIEEMTRASELPPEPEKEPEPQQPAEVEKLWTPEELMEVADKGGIKGLREIGDPMNARGRAIPELIEAILRVQDERTKAETGRLSREG